MDGLLYCSDNRVWSWGDRTVNLYDKVVVAPRLDLAQPHIEHSPCNGSIIGVDQEMRNFLVFLEADREKFKTSCGLPPWQVEGEANLLRISHIHKAPPERIGAVIKPHPAPKVGDEIALGFLQNYTWSIDPDDGDLVLLERQIEKAAYLLLVRVSETFGFGGDSGRRRGVGTIVAIICSRYDWSQPLLPQPMFASSFQCLDSVNEEKLTKALRAIAVEKHTKGRAFGMR